MRLSLLPARLTDRFERRIWNRFWYGNPAVVILVIYLASRVVTTALMLIAAAGQPPTFWIAKNPDYFVFANIWDAKWYQRIVYFGYPTTLPTNAYGHVGQNAWAFMPAYPIAVKFTMAVSGLNFYEASVLVSLISGFASCLMMYRLMRVVRLSRNQALFAVILLAFNPMAALFQSGYAEAFNLFFLLLGLWLVAIRKYIWVLAILPSMAYSRPMALAFALGLGILFCIRWRRHIKKVEVFTRREVIPFLIVGFSAALFGLSWPVIAWIVTGRLDAYVATELAWRSPVHNAKLIPFTPWPQAFASYTSHFQLPDYVGYIISVIMVSILTFLVMNRAVRRLGREIWTWNLAYLIYLVAAFFPQSSTFRLLLPLAPSLGALVLMKRHSVRYLVLIAFVIMQFIWLNTLWVIDINDSIPP